ncbi:MAG: pseudouridine-5'-phosphate glycosidase [Gemmatimonadales bacterium]|nr:pseudouridine-5'-phosphate glycosidase [Gemmatimonadales bacterium]
MDLIEVRHEVREALSQRHPVVALESTVIAHGLPRPRNLETARGMEAAVREEGAVPATIGIMEGRAVVGLSDAELETLATADHVVKASTADIAPVVAAGKLGATTVAGTAYLAALAGIRVMATGGIGGVHRGGDQSLDISADLTELARSRVAVVSAGVKSVLDLARTLEVLETLGVPVVGFGTNEFPAFYSRESGLSLTHRVDTPEAAARLLDAQWSLGLSSAIIFANPPPFDAAIDRSEMEAWIGQALETAGTNGITGKAVTPYLLGQLVELSRGRTLETNVRVLESNARLGGRVSVADAKVRSQE